MMSIAAIGTGCLYENDVNRGAWPWLLLYMKMMSIAVPGNGCLYENDVNASAWV